MQRFIATLSWDWAFSWALGQALRMPTSVPRRQEPGV